MALVVLRNATAVNMLSNAVVPTALVSVMQDIKVKFGSRLVADGVARRQVRGGLHRDQLRVDLRQLWSRHKVVR